MEKAIQNDTVEPPDDPAPAAALPPAGRCQSDSVDQTGGARQAYPQHAGTGPAGRRTIDRGAAVVQR